MFGTGATDIATAPSTRQGRVAAGGYPPAASRDPDVPHSGIRLLDLRLRCNAMSLSCVVVFWWPFGPMSPPPVPLQAPPPGRPLPSTGSLGADSPTSPVLSADSDPCFRRGRPRLPSRLASFPSLGSTPACAPFAPPEPDALPKDPDDFLCGARAASPGVEKTRPPGFLGCLAASHWLLAGYRPATRRHPPTSPRSCAGPAGATRPRFPSILLVDSVRFVVRAPQRPCCLYHSCICLTPSSTPSRVHPSCTRRSESSFASSVFPCRFISAMSYRTKAEMNTREQASKQRQ